MNLAKFPRRRYTDFPTPIEKLERLSSELAGPTIYIKRDDLLGLAGGGNKTRKLDEQQELVYELVKKTAKHVGVTFEIPREAVVCFDEYVGPGYSLATTEMAEALRMIAQLEGILMDPVYTGKALAGLIDLARKGHFAKEENVLFITRLGNENLFGSPINRDLRFAPTGSSGLG
jgi:1-aminocyclopropane-1-carboxylate deaminase/D-cysteine desulfhydrase-like pyridoxal-dependent ACC family enzyme